MLLNIIREAQILTLADRETHFDRIDWETVVSKAVGLTKSPTWVLAIPASPSIGAVMWVHSRFSLAASIAAAADCVAAALALVV